MLIVGSPQKTGFIASSLIRDQTAWLNADDLGKEVTKLIYFFSKMIIGFY